MITGHDKAIVALIMAAIALANSFGMHIGLDQGTVTIIVSLLTPMLVWLVPNNQPVPDRQQSTGG